MKYTIGAKGFIDEGGMVHEAIQTKSAISDSHTEKQNKAMGEYLDLHVTGEHSAGIKAIMRQFQGFILSNCLRSEIQKEKFEERLVLDVGCGLSTVVPYYARVISRVMHYVGLDPININHRREYRFINGAFEGLSNVIADRFDYLIFSTSLDHFVNLEDVSKEIRACIQPGGLVFFWVGIHDPAIVARFSLSRIIEWFDIFRLRDLLIALAGYPFILAYLFMRMKIRQKKLHHVPLDAFHFKYFTKDSLIQYMQSLGEIVDEFDVPFTNSVFYAVRPTYLE